MVVTTLHPGLFRAVVAEDSLLEWVEFAGYAAASLLGLAVARRLSGNEEGALAFADVLFAAACVVVAGEEVSWGQRIFELKTPESLQGINHQGEINVHRS